jgi:hypothetical protein
MRDSRVKRISSVRGDSDRKEYDPILSGKHRNTASVYLVCAAALAINLLCFFGAWAVASLFKVAPSVFYRDPNSVAGLNFSTGWLSNLGAMTWFVTATCAFFSAWLHDRCKTRTSLLLLATLSTILGADDLFMIHEGLLPFLRVPEATVYAIYPVLMLVWVGGFWPQILQTNWPVMLVALAGLFASSVLDVSNEAGFADSELSRVAEDAVKLLGISFWSVYVVDYAWAAASSLVTRRHEGPRVAE